MYRKLLFTGLIIFKSCLILPAQDKIYMGNQNADNISRVNASDLTGFENIFPTANPNGIAFFNSNPFYPLFYTNGSSIYRNNATGSSPNSIISSGFVIRGIAIDYTAKKIYWATGDGYIKRANLNGNNQQIVLSGLSAPWDIEIDAVNQKIYWTEDITWGNIKRANLSDGSSVETIVTDIKSNGLAVDPFRNKLYYTSFWDNEVYAANLDGSDEIVIATGSIRDIDVDYASGKVFFANTDKLSKSNMDGSDSLFIMHGGTFIEYADMTAPYAGSIHRHDPVTPLVYEGTSVTFRVGFSEPVFNVNADDFVLSGPVTGTIVVKYTKPGTECFVKITDLAGTGTLNLDLASTTDIIDARGNPLVPATIFKEQVYSVTSAPVILPIVTFSPNPAKYYIDAESNERISSIEIVSLDGLVQQQISAVKDKRIDISSLKPGTYVLRIYTANDMISKTFVKE